MMAASYNDIHPSSRENSVTGPNGNMIYPMNENNYISDIIRWLNKNFQNIIEDYIGDTGSAYTKHSQLAKIAKIIQNQKYKGDYELKLNLHVGLKDDVVNQGRDYFEINPLEDVVEKMILLDKNMFVLPTMADKKTFYFIELISRMMNDTEDVWKMPHDILSTSWEN